MITELDFLIMNFIHDNLSGAITDGIMIFITHLGDFRGAWIIAAIVMMLFNKTRRQGVILMLAILLTAVLGNVVLKNIFARTRPFIEANMPIIINPPGGYSFPSGHTSNSFVSATVLSAYFKKWSFLFYVMAALVGFSRVYLYVHYPSDILAGAVLGIVMGIICLKVTTSRR